MPHTPIDLLLVEDSAHDVELTLLMLEAHGLVIRPVVVYDHHGAQAALQRQTFDVIVCDYLLPSSSGLEVLEVARQLIPETPFIFLSGMMSESQAAETLRPGAIDHVLKQNLKLLPKVIRRAVSEVRERERRIQAETALEETEARARLAIEAADMGVWELNLKTMEVLWDERSTALYEVSSQTQMTLAQAMELTHPDDLEPVRASVREALSSASSFHAEYRILLPDGRTKWLLSNGRSIFKEDQCIRFSGVIQDVTDRKRATQTLLQQNATLGKRVEQQTREHERIWEVSRELLAVLQFDMTLVTSNPAWNSGLGWSDAEMANGGLRKLVHPDDLEMTLHEMQNIAKGNISTRFVNRLQHANGQYRWLSWTIVPDAGLMYAAVRDITEEHRISNELESLNQRLLVQIEEREKVEATLQQMQRLEVVGQLTAGIAHDFNNLLTIVLHGAALAEKAHQRGAFEKIPSRLNSIRDAGERGAKLTAQLLSFARKQSLKPKPLNLNQTITGMQGLLTKALGHSVWLETALFDELWMASADPTQTEMIVLNLAINARDAMEQGGTLTISTSNVVVDTRFGHVEGLERGNYVAIAVKDTGSGMAPDILNKAFEPFFTTKDVGKGSGLGLAQVFGFARQSGGGVGIESIPGEGTVVTVYLPRTPSDASIAPREVTQPASLHKMLNIMLVDDDDAVRQGTAMMLESLGHRVVEASSGAEALTALDAEIDLVITDYAMPGMSGMEMSKVIASTFPTLPVLYITGYADIADMQLTNAIIVQKPFSESDLQAKISEAYDG